jgi:hypothetical protein
MLLNDPNQNSQLLQVKFLQTGCGCASYSSKGRNNLSKRLG